MFGQIKRAAHMLWQDRSPHFKPLSRRICSSLALLAPYSPPVHPVLPQTNLSQPLMSLSKLSDELVLLILKFLNPRAVFRPFSGPIEDDYFRNPLVRAYADLMRVALISSRLRNLVCTTHQDLGKVIPEKSIEGDVHRMFTDHLQDLCKIPEYLEVFVRSPCLGLVHKI